MQQTNANNEVDKTQKIMNFRAGMYWYGDKPIQFGPSHRPQPVVLVLEDGQLSMTSSGAVAFDVPVSAVSVEFMKLSGMRVTVNGTRYLLGMEKESGKPFTKEQLELLHGGPQGNNHAVSGVGVALTGGAVAGIQPRGIATGAAGGAVAGLGLAEGLWSLHDIDKVINTWESVFANNGIYFTKRIHHNARNVLVIVGVILLIAGIMAFIGSKMSQGN